MSFARLLSEAIASESLPSTGDVLAVGLPFLRDLDEVHRSGMVTRWDGVDALHFDGSVLALDQELVQRPRVSASVGAIDPRNGGAAVDVTSRLTLDIGDGAHRDLQSADVFDGHGRPTRPVLVEGYRAWEQLHGHHDQVTDVHLAGLVLISYAAGLDLERPESVQRLALDRRHLLRLNQWLHPVVAGVLADMIEPSRHARPPDLGEVIARLEHHRELPADLDLSEAYTSELGWRRAVLSTLRERVFDVTRRNRALYFRPTATSLSLTDASVPLMLDVARISPDDLLTWTGGALEEFCKGKRVDLERWCRFDESPHLVPGLEKLISTERKLRAEHGQGRLHLIVAFLRWADPESQEVITSPLLLLPAQLTKKKGVKPRYFVEVEPEAIVNPVLRHVLRSRFDIGLPERLDPDAASIEGLVAHLEQSIQTTDPSVRVELIDKPRVRLIKRRAQLRVDAYRRRRAASLAASGRWRRQDHSYDDDDWRPLGLALYRRFVEPAELPMRAIAGAADDPLRRPRLAASSDTSTREVEHYSTDASEVDRQRWEVDLCSVTLASMGSRRTNLARDYDALLGGELEHPPQSDAPFDRLFSPQSSSTVDQPSRPLAIDQMLVLPADRAQSSAVRRGVDGDSFIIQGPPGTGKSQTITNLIAALAAEGRRVLFVCEKRAALDVVARRLEHVGLDDLVATIHDAKLDRKAFIQALGETYERWLQTGPGDDEERRLRALAAVEDRLRPVEHAFADLSRSDLEGASLGAVIERLVALRASGVERVETTGVAAGPWLRARPDLDRVIAALERSGLSPVASEHAVLRLRPAALMGEDGLTAARRIGVELGSLLDRLVESAGLERSVVMGGVSVRDLDVIADARHTIARLRDRDALSVLRSDAPQRHRLLALAERMRTSTVEAGRASEPLRLWSSPLTLDDARAGLATALDKESSALRWFSGRWRRVKKTVSSAYRFDQHQIPPTITQVLTDLVAALEAMNAAEQLAREAIDTFGTEDLDGLLVEVAELDAHPLAPSLDGPRGLGVVEASNAVQQLCAERLIAPGPTLAELAEVGEGLRSASVAHEDALLVWSELEAVPIEVLEAVLASPHGLDSIERSALERTIEDRLGSVAPSAGLQLDGVVERLLAEHDHLLAANVDVINGRSRRVFLEHVAWSEASMAGRSDADKEFKRAYRAGRKLLEREFQKKMRHRSIRELATGDSGLVLRDIKPVWLMSPLSVSDTLPLDPTPDGDAPFDVVIFDEASQIPVEDAIPSLYRAAQVVVVGDRMQLPPTRFFAADSDDGDEIVVDADGHRLSISLDADSFLTQADLTLGSELLEWHYRSRSESLIAYSNHAFYGARLATVPDRQLDAGSDAALVATAPEDARRHLPATLDRPISFHRIANGVYRQRRNQAEADYIAELVRSVLEAEVGLSVGIVAFSEAQQTAIETALEELADVDRSFGERLAAEEERTDDGEFAGLFVKNLENVQGDERDLIIMSVCYGPDEAGRMKMNFGPINQAGGERRLNVIFSRARRHMVVVSSIEGSQITNLHNDGAANLAGFLDYAAAESIGDTSRAGSILASLTPDPNRSGHPVSGEPSRSAVAAELADRLRVLGWTVDLEVGRSSFTIDVGVRIDDSYALGVVIDPGDRGAAAGERLIAEARVLAGFGWPIARVLLSECWTDLDRVVERIDHRLRR